jgi:hypothetical protein
MPPEAVVCALRMLLSFSSFPAAPPPASAEAKASLSSRRNDAAPAECVAARGQPAAVPQGLPGGAGEQTVPQLATALQALRAAVRAQQAPHADCLARGIKLAMSVLDSGPLKAHLLHTAPWLARWPPPLLSLLEAPLAATGSQSLARGRPPERVPSWRSSPSRVSQRQAAPCGPWADPSTAVTATDSANITAGSATQLCRWGCALRSPPGCRTLGPAAQPLARVRH